MCKIEIFTFNFKKYYSGSLGLDFAIEYKKGLKYPCRQLKYPSRQFL